LGDEQSMIFVIVLVCLITGNNTSKHRIYAWTHTGRQANDRAQVPVEALAVAGLNVKADQNIRYMVEERVENVAYQELGKPVVKP
jgi:hypothetical protein